MSFVTQKKSLVSVHLSVLLFGAAGLFGKIINISAMQIVLGRVIFASLALGVFIKFSKIEFTLNSIKDYTMILFSGFIIAIHWVSFFYAIQISTVAIGLLTFSTFPIFVTFFEPLFFKTKFSLKNIVIAIITLFGVAMVIPEFHLTNKYTIGALWGIFSGLTFAILAIFNKKYVQKYSSLLISFYQNGIASVLLLPFLFQSNLIFELNNILLLLLLGIVFTALAHSLFIYGLKKTSAVTASIIACLEPVYGVLFAIVFLNEMPEQKIWLGGIIILFTTIYISISSHQKI